MSTYQQCDFRCSANISTDLDPLKPVTIRLSICNEDDDTDEFAEISCGISGDVSTDNFSVNLGDALTMLIVRVIADLAWMEGPKRVTE